MHYLCPCSTHKQMSLPATPVHPQNDEHPGTQYTKQTKPQRNKIHFSIASSNYLWVPRHHPPPPLPRISLSLHFYFSPEHVLPHSLLPVVKVAGSLAVAEPYPGRLVHPDNVGPGVPRAWVGRRRLAVLVHGAGACSCHLMSVWFFFCRAWFCLISRFGIGVVL